MKKLFFVIALFLLSLGAQAQDNTLLQQILEVNSAATSFESDLSNTMHKKGQSTTQDGKLYFVKPDKFAALFYNGRYMVVNVDRLRMDIGMFHGSFKLKKNGMMRSLSNIFLYGFQGRCKDLADENDYDMELKEAGAYQQVTFTNKKHNLLGIGYKQVIFKFEKETLKLREIILIDNRDTEDSYSISDVQYNVKIDNKKFN